MLQWRARFNTLFNFINKVSVNVPVRQLGSPGAAAGVFVALNSNHPLTQQALFPLSPSLKHSSVLHLECLTFFILPIESCSMQVDKRPILPAKGCFRNSGGPVSSLLQ